MKEKNAELYIRTPENKLIKKQDIDFEYAMSAYWGRMDKKGTYYVHMKGIKLPYPLA